MDNQQKLDEIREIMTAHGVDAYLVPRTDEYQGEYVPACAERLAWLTGFTGSAGLAVIMAGRAMVMSDGRYTIQLVAQVDNTLYECVNSQETSPVQWLKEYCGKNKSAVIGYDPKLHTPAQIAAKEKEGLVLKAIDQNLIDQVWQDRPAAPCAPVGLFPEKYAGVSAAHKIKDIQTQLAEEGADAVILTMSDSIAWALNIRGNDIPFIPVALSYVIVPVSGKVQWFIHPDKITDTVQQTLSEHVEFLDEEKLKGGLSDLKDKRVWLDPKRSSIWFQNKLGDVLAKDDPCILPRACKTKSEQAAMKAAHIRDGVALVKFLKWFDEKAPTETLDELSVEKKLESFRRYSNEFKEPSFSTIAGYGSNGAIVHYRADEASNQQIKIGNLLLLDSGAQYEDGTTDITRTMAVGDVPQEMREHYTLVLKGHIALARACFDAGTTGKDIDALARAPLQGKGLDYSHGTGHGVGCYLSVHEEAASISPRGEQALEAGMIISNEPGYYAQGSHGIRIENLVLVCADAQSGKLFFETITLAPIDKSLIVKSMMGADEIEWLNDYHARVYKALSPLLDDNHGQWLKQNTQPLSSP